MAKKLISTPTSAKTHSCYTSNVWSEEAFKMQHDIYSLGVCLLEIALWRSFVLCGPGESISEQYPWSDPNIQDAICDRNSRRGGRAMKNSSSPSPKKDLLTWLVISIPISFLLVYIVLIPITKGISLKDLRLLLEMKTGSR